MRRALVQQLIEQDNENIYFLTADVGFNVLEPLQEKMGDRFINVGLAEQSMMGIAAGLALSGRKVYTYTMCAFYLRAIEQIRNDICYQDVPVTMIGVGLDYEYEYLGSTHYALEDEKIIGSLRNIEVYTPPDIKALQNKLQVGTKMPLYLRLSKTDKAAKGYVGHINHTKYPKYGASKEYLLENDNAN